MVPWLRGWPSSRNATWAYLVGCKGVLARLAEAHKGVIARLTGNKPCGRFPMTRLRLSLVSPPGVPLPLSESYSHILGTDRRPVLAAPASARWWAVSWRASHRRFQLPKDGNRARIFLPISPRPPPSLPLATPTRSTMVVEARSTERHGAHVSSAVEMNPLPSQSKASSSSWRRIPLSEHGRGKVDTEGRPAW